MIVINLLAGPGTGKSTNAAALFALMKRQYMNVELVQEFAKDLTWDEHYKLREEQDWVLANQNRRLRRLVGKVDFAITDGPLVQSMVYVPDDFYISGFKQHVLDVHNSYNNLNFFLTRVKRYVPIGRDQTEEQARKKDQQILNMLGLYNIKFHTVTGDESCPEAILNIIKESIRLDTAA